MIMGVGEIKKLISPCDSLFKFFFVQMGLWSRRIGMLVGLVWLSFSVGDFELRTLPNIELWGIWSVPDQKQVRQKLSCICLRVVWNHPFPARLLWKKNSGQESFEKKSSPSNIINGDPLTVSETPVHHHLRAIYESDVRKMYQTSPMVTQPFYCF